MKTRHFQDLQVWQKGMNLVQLVYAATNEFPKAEIFGLTSQMRRAAISVPSNIAEGHGLATEKQFVHSLCQARGSLYELHTQIEVAMRLEYLRTQDGASLIEECGSIAHVERLAENVEGIMKQEASPTRANRFLVNRSLANRSFANGSHAGVAA